MPHSSSWTRPPSTCCVSLSPTLPTDIQHWRQSAICSTSVDSLNTAAAASRSPTTSWLSVNWRRDIMSNVLKIWSTNCTLVDASSSRSTTSSGHSSSTHQPADGARRTITTWREVISAIAKTRLMNLFNEWSKIRKSFQFFHLKASVLCKITQRIKEK